MRMLTRLRFLTVVPRAGTWIETDQNLLEVKNYTVVPRAGTWIETYRAIEELAF